MKTQQIQFIDLGLPSGTLWADTNNDECTAFEMTKEYAPNTKQFIELLSLCKQEMTELPNGVPALLLTGRNGNSISLPFDGYGRPVYDTKCSDGETPKYVHKSEKDIPIRKPRLYDRRGFDRGYYHTSDWRDDRNIIIELTPEGFETYVSENTYRFSLRMCKQKEN